MQTPPARRFRGRNGAARGSNGRSPTSNNYTTSTPSRQSAPNLTTTTVDLDLELDLDEVAAAEGSNIFANNVSAILNNVNSDLTAEVDLSDENLGVTPLQDSHEDTPMFFTPRSQSRVVRIISKQSNV